MKKHIYNQVRNLLNKYIERIYYEIKMLKKIIQLLIIFAISILIGNMAYGMYREAQLENGPSNFIGNNKQQTEENINSTTNTMSNSTTNSAANSMPNSTTNSETNSTSEKNNLIPRLPNKYKGYEVSSKLSIPKIDLETYILNSQEDDAMWLCPTVYFGPEPNEVGNYCIAAHNYDKENMFNHIIELKVGDNLTLEDNKNGIKTYEIYDIYKVKPTDTEVLSQKTNGRTELTLITCSDYSSTRIIVKAFAK